MTPDASRARLILYHKQSTSARTRFLRLDYGGICAFDPLPALSSYIDVDDDFEENDNVMLHPAQLISNAELRMGLDSGGLSADGDFHARVDTPNGIVHVYLARFTTIDPPFETAEHIGGKFIALTEARGRPPAEMELLRQAYAVVMEG